MIRENAAHRAEKARLANAWRTTEFQNALHFTIALGQIKHLIDYLTSTKPLSRQDRRALAGYILSLRKKLDSQKTVRGRKPRVPSEAPVYEQAEQNAAWLLAFRKKAWLEKHDGKRVPGRVLETMLSDAIKEVAKAFKISEQRINPDNIRNALKSGRVVVR